MMGTIQEHLVQSGVYVSRDISTVKVSDFARGVLSFKSNQGVLKDPQIEALNYYITNQIIADTLLNFEKLEVLPSNLDILVSQSITSIPNIAARMVSYLFLIVTREARHCLWSSDKFHEKVVSKYGSEFYKFIRGVEDSKDSGYISVLLSNMPEMSLGLYIEALEFIFQKGLFKKSFGGSPWYNIACTLGSFIRGKSNPDMLVDTSFSLSHNCGSIFNKGMIYSQHDSSLLLILDAQRSGQIMRLMDKGILSEKISVDVNSITIFLEVAEAYHSIFKKERAELDYDLMMQLGAVGKYKPSKKAANHYIHVGKLNFLKSAR
jgi:hypothetical protein